MHCVQGSFGAEFVQGLDTSNFERVFVKGTDPAIDSYSGFFDNGHLRSTGLGEFLKQRGVREVFIFLLALDQCVKYTVLDALELGFATFLILDGCRPINLQEGDSEQAVKEMTEKGAIIVSSTEIRA